MFRARKRSNKTIEKKNLWAFPNYCQCCGIRLLGSAKQLCRYCILSELPRIYPEPKKGMYPEGIQWKVACWKYHEDHIIQRVIFQLKYKRAYGIGLDLGQAAADLFQQIYPDKYQQLMTEKPIVIPIPLSRQRRNLRGYNQSYSIAEGWTALMSFPVLGEGVIERKPSRVHQVGKSKLERRMNRENIYKIVCPTIYDWTDRPVLILDDVYTTGSTCFAFWHFLKSVGFNNAYVITLAQS